MTERSLDQACAPTAFTAPDFAEVSAAADALDAGSLLDSRDHPAGRAATALALYRSTEVPTEDIVAAATRLAERRSPRLHTFSPLYTTNHCDSDCKMCGMRRSNTGMVRRFSGKREIEEQLRILLEHEGVRGVGFLTGEYDEPYTRLANAFRIGWAIERAFQLGFDRVYYNIGSMTDEEIAVLGEWITPEQPVTMCVFQETYNRTTYDRFMGGAGAPKADYDRRLSSFDRWLDAGFRHVNPGALIGLHDVESEIVALVAHAEHLDRRGAVVDVSVPRLRPALASSNKTKVDDDSYVRLIACVALACPDNRIVLTNREDRAFRARVLDLCGVISPGSPDVAPYRRSDAIANEENSSQFLVAELSRPSVILADITSTGRSIASFDEPVVAR
ncbi:3-methyl-2-indolic acid synthase [Actinokineospora inagensis]|uniref:3-methyl-2-indolic acid synthase n=1 Tax=Actinokineospora inagensis TaxID=103730 RepID=UPI00040146DE|nr:3-methyl-2-indolic acid synthase [Actinokineospora inagensis]